MFSFALRFDPTIADCLAHLIDTEGSYTFFVPSDSETELMFEFHRPGCFSLPFQEDPDQVSLGIVALPKNLWSAAVGDPDPLQEECVLEMLMFFVADGLLKKDTYYLVVEEVPARIFWQPILPERDLVALYERGFKIASGCQTSTWSALVQAFGGKENTVTLDIADVDGRAGWGRKGNRQRLFTAEAADILPMYLVGYALRYIPGTIEYLRPSGVADQDRDKIRCAKELLDVLGGGEDYFDSLPEQPSGENVNVYPMYFAELKRLFVAGLPFGAYRKELQRAYDLGNIWKEALCECDVASPFQEGVDIKDLPKALEEYAFEIGVVSYMEALDAGVPAEDVLLEENEPWKAP